MYKDATYKKKFSDLQEWFPLIIEAIKKDLRNEHLKKDVLFIKKYFSSKNIHKLTTEELVEAYHKAIQEEEQGENLAEFVTSRWLLNHSDLYDFFEQELSKIHPDFSNLDEIGSSQAAHLIDVSVHAFGAPQTYLFSVLNSVVFPPEQFERLQALARDSYQQSQLQLQKQEEERQDHQAQKNQELSLARLADKYEKKLAGLQKKYVTDTENLKKQIAQLQRKLQEKKG